MISKKTFEYLDHLLIKNYSKKFLVKDSKGSNNLKQLKERFNYIVNLLLKKVMVHKLLSIPGYPDGS